MGRPSGFSVRDLLDLPLSDVGGSGRERFQTATGFFTSHPPHHPHSTPYSSLEHPDTLFPNWSVIQPTHIVPAPDHISSGGNCVSSFKCTCAAYAYLYREFHNYEAALLTI
jgi:hypothetical protein